MKEKSFRSIVSSAIGQACVTWANLHESSLEQFREGLVDAWERSARLPAGRRKQVRRAIATALMHVPAVDPTRDAWLQHPIGAPKQGASGNAVFITGATGFVGIHLLAYLLEETDRRLICLARDASKVARSAETYGLELPGLDARVTFLDGNIRDLTRWIRDQDPIWQAVADDIGIVFHLACNTSFTSHYEILRREWMPVFAELCGFCAKTGAAMHLAGSVGRFAVEDDYRTKRGAWSSCYMRLKHVQCAMAQRFFEQGMAGSVIDCPYIIGSTERGIHPGLHDSLWLVAAMQTHVGASFPADAAVVPVDLFVRAVWRNATLPPGHSARYLNLRLRRVMTSEDLGVARQISPAEFRTLAKRKSMPGDVIDALVPDDIDSKVRRMVSRPLEGPPAVLSLFEGLDDAAIIQKSIAHARLEFGRMHERLQRVS